MRTTRKIHFLPGKLIFQSLVGLLLFLPGLSAQHNLALYQMQSIPQSFELNPGRLPQVKGYLQLPGLSGVGLGVGNNSFGLKELGLQITDFDPRLSLDSLLEKSKDDNRLGLSGSVQLFGLGFSAAKGKVFIGLSVRERFEARGSLPKSVFVLADDINQENFVPGKVYDFANLNFNLLHYRSIGLGVGMKLSSRLSAGVRFSYLAGQENLWTVNNGFQLNAVGDRSVFNIEGGFDVYSAGLARLADGADITELLTSFDNSGFAVDLGVNYRYSDKWSFSASILDLGAIRWKSNVSGVRFTETIGDPIEQLEEAVSDMADGELESDVVYSTPLPLKFYLGGQYHLTPETSLGLLYNSRSIQGATDNALSFSFSTFLRKWFGLSLNASAYNRRFFNFGAGLSINLGPLQAFAVSDNIFGVLGAGRSLDAHAGVNFTFGWRSKETKIESEEPVAVSPEFNPVAMAEEPASTSKKERRRAKKEKRAADAEMEMPAPPANPSRAYPAPQEDPVAVVAEEPAPKPRKKKRRAKKEKRPGKTSPEQPTQPVVSTPLARTGIITLHATVRDYDTDELAPPIYLDVYKLEPGGGQTVMRRDYFPNGAFDLKLQSNTRYLLDFKVHGFAPMQIEVDPAVELRQGNSFEKLFFIRKESPPTAAPQPTLAAEAPVTSQPVQEPATETPTLPQPPRTLPLQGEQPPRTLPLQGEQPPRTLPLQGEQPQPKPQPQPAPQPQPQPPGNTVSPPSTPSAPANYGIYKLTDRTSLRQRATHESAVLQRLAEGQPVELLEKTNTWWWKVRCNGRTGYAKAKLLKSQ